MPSRRRGAPPNEFRGALVNPWVFPPLFPDFTLLSTRSPFGGPDVALVSLAAMVPEVPVELFDGAVSATSVEDFVRGCGRYAFVGIRAAASINALNVHALAAAVKARHPACVVIIGGHHATLHHREWMAYARGDVDVVVRNEGEATFRELVDAIRDGRSFEGIDGITWRDGAGAVHVAPDRAMLPSLDALPLPLFHLWGPDKDRYDAPLAGPPGLGLVEASRGCRSACGFCATGPMWRYSHRTKSVERVVEEIATLRRLGHVRYVFADDHINNDPEWLLTLCDALAREHADLAWMTMASAKPFADHPDLARAMAAAGCKTVMLGYESTEQTARDALRKGPLVAMEGRDYERVYRRLRRAGVHVQGLFMHGYPGETLGQTLAAIRRAWQVSDWSASQPYEAIPDTLNHPGREGFGRFSFYRVPLPFAGDEGGSLATSLLAFGVRGVPYLKALRRPRGTDNACMARYRVGIHKLLLRRPPARYARLTRLIWDARRPVRERHAALVDAALRLARELGRS